ncbi:MAG: biopolymer transporter ExbD [Rhodobacteraceae bacterium]|nr:biopolymer transporter ExbD [Paracoccaceae bacterium]MCP5342848.1 biopolymer transporter ExbD [Paracoccaceae bacterium]
MKLRRPPRRGQPETIIALIDVVFFLLVFFLLIGRMDATAPFDMAPPTALGGTEMPGGGATVSISAQGALALNGAALDRKDTLRGLALLLENTPDLLIRINAHRDSELRNVLPLVGEIEALGARDIVLVVTPGLP